LSLDGYLALGDVGAHTS